MTGKFRGLIPVLLFAYPRGFREEYRASIAAHFDEDCTTWAQALRVCLDIVGGALAMRAEALWLDLVYAARMNLKHPLFTLIVVGTLALAIGANAVIFALLDTVLLKPLPYAHADRLAFVYGLDTRRPGRGLMMVADDRRTFDALANSRRAFSSVTVSAFTAPLFDPSTSSAVEETRVTPNFFQTLGVRPELGNFFSSAHQVNAAVISDAFWHKRFGGSPSALGQRINLSGALYSVIGVAPAGFLNPDPGGYESGGDAWTLFNPAIPNQRIEGIALVRLVDGVSWKTAQADADELGRGLRTGPISLHVQSLESAFFANAKPFFWIVFGAVTGVLLIACANVGNLLLARTSAREGEFSIRACLGAPSARIAGQIFCETSMLCGSGALLGLIIAKFALPAAIALVPVKFPRLASTRLDADSLLYTCLLVVVSAIIAGLAPALATRPRRAAGRSPMRAVLIAFEVAIAFALTVSCGLLIRSFVAITHVDVGFDPANVYAASFLPSQIPSAPTAMPVDRVTRLRDAIAGLPGVQDTALATVVPFASNFMMALPLLPAGFTSKERADAEPIGIGQVSPNYFALMHINVVRGSVPAGGVVNGPQAALVSETYARRFFGQTNPVGKTVEIDTANRWRIVGVVADVRSSLTDDPQPFAYLVVRGSIFGPAFQLAIRTRGSVPRLSEDLRRLTKQIDPALNAPAIASLQQAVTGSALRTQTSLLLLGVLAAVALLLALLGIYAVVSFETERRLHEIGIRFALGADGLRVVRAIVAATLIQSLLGLAAGTVLAALTTNLLRAQLFRTSPLDPPTFALVALCLAACAALAALIPAARASSMNPSALLRFE